MTVDWLLWSRALHVVAFVAWLAAIWALPRLYARHASAAVGTESSEIFKVMERRVLKRVGTPAMVATFVFGLAATTLGYHWSFGWLHTKLLLVLALAGLHGVLAADLKKFARDERPRSAGTYRVLGHVPSVLLVVIVWLAVFRPF